MRARLAGRLPAGLTFYQENVYRKCDVTQIAHARLSSPWEKIYFLIPFFLNKKKKVAFPSECLGQFSRKLMRGRSFEFFFLARRNRKRKEKVELPELIIQVS